NRQQDVPQGFLLLLGRYDNFLEYELIVGIAFLCDRTQGQGTHCDGQPDTALDGDAHRSPSGRHGLVASGSYCAPKHARPQLAVSAATPAAATWPSWLDCTPDTPMLPTISPSTTMGRPPSTEVMPGRDIMCTRPDRTVSSSILVGRLNISAVRDFSCATTMDPSWVPSARSR